MFVMLFIYVSFSKLFICLFIHGKGNPKLGNPFFAEGHLASLSLCLHSVVVETQ